MPLKDDIKNTFYSSVGVMLKGKEKVEEAARSFASKYNMNAEEGEKFIKEAMNKATETKEEVEVFIEEKVNSISEKIGFIKRDEYDELKNKYDELKSQLDELKNK